MKLLSVFFLIGQQIGADQLSRKDQYVELGTKILDLPDPAKPGDRSALAHKWSRPEAELARQYVRTLRDLATATVLEALADGRSKNLTSEVRRSLQDLQGNLAEATWTNLPYVEKGIIKGREVEVVAFSVLQGAAAIPEPTPFIQFYVAESGMWRLAAEAPNDMEGRATRIVLLRSPVDNEVWLLAYGRRYGDTGARVSARLYAFDGGSVRTLWGRDELIGGGIAVNDNRITVTYYVPARRGLDPPESEEYLITPHGLTRVR